jgi:hypothetical protein
VYFEEMAGEQNRCPATVC